MTRHERVAAYVRRTCPDADLLLEIIGVTRGGVMQPDDVREYADVDTAQLGSRGRGGPVQSDEMLRRPHVSSAPVALRELPPEVVVPPKSKPKPAPKAAAGAKKPYSPRKTQIGSPAQIAADQATARGRFAPCGTYGSYRRHLRHHEPIDEACAEAARVQWRERDRDRARTVQPRKLVACGTDAGYRRHIRHSTDVCHPCREAHNERNRQLHAQKRNAA